MSAVRANGFRATALPPRVVGARGGPCTGASLLEVLVAISLLAISLLGLAAAQLAALRDADAQSERERAVWIAVSIAEAKDSSVRPAAISGRWRAHAAQVLPAARVSIVEDMKDIGAVVVHWENAVRASEQVRSSNGGACARLEGHAFANCIALPFARGE